MKYISFLAAAALVFLYAIPAYADDHDITLQQTSGSYTVTMRYPTAYQATIPSWINLFLTQTNDQRSVPFSSVDIVIAQDTVPYWSTTIAKKVGIATGGIITFPRTGTYAIHVTFYDSKNTLLADTIFTVPVQQPANQARILGLPLTRELGIGAVGGIILSTIFVQYERWMRSQDQP